MALSHQLAFASIIGAVIYVAITTISNRRRMKGAKSPPGPKPLPLFGNILDIAPTEGNLIPLFGKWATEYGPIVQFDILGEKNVIISDDKIARDLFVKRGTIYSHRSTPHAAQYVTNNMNTALISKNDTWRRSRKLIHSAVSMAANTKYQSLMTDEATLTLHDLATDPSNFSRHFQRYSYGVLARSLLGFRITSTDDNFVIQKEYILDEAMKCFLPDHYPSNIFPFLRVLPGWLVPSVAKLEMLREKVDTEVKRLRKMVEDGIKDGTSLDCIYRHFIEHRDEWAAISDEEAEYAIDSVIGAATRSPFNALLTTCYLMMEYPEWMEKMQKQVDEVVGREGGRIPTFADIPNLPVVRAVVKESIRYRSIKAELGIPHQLAEHDVYEGYFFAKGTVFHANYPVILMDKEMYPDQQVFNPARWLEPSYPTYQEPLTEFPNCKNFVPFGYGRRACPGLDFAERALVIMVAQLACAFDIRKPQDPISGEPVHIEIEYEKGPNPKPLPFPCDISLRSGNNPLKSRDLPPALSTR